MTPGAWHFLHDLKKTMSVVVSEKTFWVIYSKSIYIPFEHWFVAGFDHRDFILKKRERCYTPLFKIWRLQYQRRLILYKDIFLLNLHKLCDRLVMANLDYKNMVWKSCVHYTNLIFHIKYESSRTCDFTNICVKEFTL